MERNLFEEIKTEALYCYIDGCTILMNAYLDDEVRNGNISRAEAIRIATEVKNEI